MLGVPLGSADRLCVREAGPLAEEVGGAVETGVDGGESEEVARRDAHPEALGLLLSRDEWLDENEEDGLKLALLDTGALPLGKRVALGEPDTMPLREALVDDDDRGDEDGDGVAARLASALVDTLADLDGRWDTLGDRLARGLRDPLGDVLGVPLGSAYRLGEREGRPLAVSVGGAVEIGVADAERVVVVLRDTQPEALGLPLSREDALGEKEEDGLKLALLEIWALPLGKRDALADTDMAPLRVALVDGDEKCDEDGDEVAARLASALADTLADLDGSWEAPDDGLA